MAKLVWTPELLAEARRLWDDGVSASTIAERLGLTKGQVIGRVHRLGWGSRPTRVARPTFLYKPIDRPQDRPRTHAARPKPPRPKLPPTLLDLKPHMCKWPINSPPKGGEYWFCGEGTVNGHAYCEHHQAIGFSGTKRQPTTAGWQPRQAGF